MFESEMRRILGSAARSKGYGKLLAEFILRYFPDYALGELVYKAVRYKARGDSEDLVKAACWAKLLWEAHSESRRNTKGAGRNRKG